MYKNYELSTMAKALVKELKSMGVEVSHAKALEVSARVVGARTLHVQQAADKPEKSLEQRAWEHVEKVLFRNAGAWKGKMPQLKETLAQHFGPRFQDLGKDEQDNTVWLAWEGPLKGVQFTYLANDLPAESLSSTVQGEFDKALQTLKGLAQEQSSIALAKAQEIAKVAAGVARQAASAEEAAQRIEETFRVSAESGSPQVLFDGPVLDWEVETDVPDLTERQRQAKFEAKVTRDGSQISVDIAPAHKDPEALNDENQLALVIEINRGLPCVHLSNAVYGDIVLSVFGTKDGLYLAPCDSVWAIRTGAPRGEVLQELDKWQRENDSHHFNAFIEAPVM